MTEGKIKHWNKRKKRNPGAHITKEGESESQRVPCEDEEN